MKTLYAFLAAGFLMVALAGSPSADVLTVSPSQAVVLPSDGSGVTRVALMFDLSALRPGEGRRIDEALLDWRFPGVPLDRRSEYEAYAVTAPWTTWSETVSSEEEPIAFWDIETIDYEKNRGGFVRLDLGSLVGIWAAGARANYGIVVATLDVGREAFLGRLGDARLTVRYGFVR